MGVTNPLAAFHVQANSNGIGYGSVLVDYANTGKSGGSVTIRNSGGGTGAFASLLFEVDGSTASVNTATTPITFNVANGMIYCLNMDGPSTMASKMGFQVWNGSSEVEMFTLMPTGNHTMCGGAANNYGLNFPTGGCGIHWGSGYSRIFDDGDLHICTDDNLHFHTGSSTTTAGTERITLLAGGKVGIGSATPTNLFDVGGQITIGNGTTNYVYDSIIFKNSIGSTYPNIKCQGNYIGIYVSTAAGWVNDSLVGDMVIRTAGNAIRFCSDGTGTSNMVLTSSGNLGLGIATPNANYTLDVAGNARFSSGNYSWALFGPNATWGGYLIVGATTRQVNTSMAQVISTSGNLHLDCGSNNVLYLNYYNIAEDKNSSTVQIYGPTYLNGFANVTGNMVLGNPTYTYGRLDIHNPISGAVTIFGYNTSAATVNFIRGNTIFDTSFVTIGSNYDFNIAALYINASNLTYFYLGYYYQVNGQTAYNYYGNWSVAIWTVGVLVTESWYGTTSDERIKKNIQPVGNMLDTINKIEVVSFDFIDEYNNKRDECGVIAQQVESVFPNAVDKSIGVIPCFMKIGTCSLTTNGKVCILFDQSDEPLVVNDVIKIYVGGDAIDRNKKESAHNVTIISLVEGGVIVDKWDKFDITENLFVYGKQVDDFRNVDKDQLAILALKGVQELSAQNTQQAQQIQTLTEQNTALSTQVATLQTQLAAIMAKLSM